jgi:DNA-3-methyladenine glycosylase II
MKAPLGSRQHYEDALAHFQLKDKKLASLVEQQGYQKFHFRERYFESLVRIIIGQQVSVKAAEAIYNKFLQGIGGDMIPSAFYELEPSDLRPFGVSSQKSAYIIDLVKHFNSNQKLFENIEELSDEEIIKLLVQVKGIGNWTAQIFLMFTLGRANIFPVDDLGLKNAMLKLYGWKTMPTKDKLIEKAKKWSPYSTLASRYLWMSLNNKG